MSLQTFGMPDVGEGLTEAEILSWHVAVGDDIAVNQIFVEIETAKAAVELPSPFAGRVHALLVQPGVTVAVGTPIISVDTDPGSGSGPLPGSATGAAGAASATGAAAQPAEPATDQADPSAGGALIGEVAADGRIATLVGYVSPGAGTTRRQRKPVPGSTTSTRTVPPPSVVTALMAAPKAAPPVRKLAKDHGIDLATIHPSRADGVITRSEVEYAFSFGIHAGAPLGSEPGSAGYDPVSRERRIPIKGVRKLTAQAMVASAFSAPHVTEFLTVDVTPLMDLRERLRRRPEFAEVRLTPLAFVARAVCLAARRTPEINSVWDGDAGEIVVKEYMHLGIAAATPRGLIVPKVRDADRLGLRELAVALAELAATARDGRTAPAALTEGTFTITNVGVFGVDTGTPIINPGESAILALGSIKDMPWVVDGQLAVRKVCQLALSFDHRVIDGQQGSQFLADLGALLADPALALSF